MTVRIERIVESGDPRLAAYRDLRDPASARAGLFIAQSRTVVRRLLAVVLALAGAKMVLV